MYRRAQPLDGTCAAVGFDEDPNLYEIDEKDELRALAEMPQSDVGAPAPRVLAQEGVCVLAYRTVDDLRSGLDRIALVRIDVCYAHLFGPPNDEAIRGHPLHARGLRPYAAYEVVRSSWIRLMERRNAVHPHHRPERYSSRRHVIFTFHDSTFECVCDGFTVHVTTGSPWSVVPEMAELVER